MVDGRPVPCCGELSQSRGFVDVEVVPEQDDRSAELGGGGDEQVAVVAPGEALVAVAVAVVAAGPVDQPESVAGFSAGQRGDGDASAGAAADAHHRGAASL